MGSDKNITGPDGGNGTSTFIARRQDHVLFTSEVDLDFQPKVDGEEAGMTLFIQRLQHFDLGVVAIQNGTQLDRFIRLKTITANSTNQGMSDTISSPGIMMLPPNANHLRLKVQAVNASFYEFSFAQRGSSKFTTVGFGAAHQVSGGYTGVSVSVYLAFFNP
jgi:beta-xylosidase